VRAYEPFDRVNSQAEKVARRSCLTRCTFVGLVDQVTAEKQLTAGAWKTSESCSYGACGENLSLVDSPVSDTSSEKSFVVGFLSRSRQLPTGCSAEHGSDGAPVIARFRRDGVHIELDKSEYIFVHLALSYVLDGVALVDHDFANILGMRREDAEAFRDSLVETERVAKAQGNHWSPRRPPDV
jgi:hypothetical protein